MEERYEGFPTSKSPSRPDPACLQARLEVLYKKHFRVSHGNIRFSRHSGDQDQPGGAMSNRHRNKQSGPTSALPEERDNRKAEHRRLRRTVHQALHVASLDDDHDGLVLDRPHATHGYTNQHESPDPHSVQIPRNRMRHWKQSFWKRRNNERRRKNEQLDFITREA